MFGAKSGFAFSLDSFVAFSLILIAVQSIVVISSTPSGYYSSLMQANLLASATMDVLSDVKIDSDNKDALSYAVDAALSGDSTRANKLAMLTNELIPRPYSYAYDFYDFETKRWRMAYNASEHSLGMVGENKYYNVSFNRVQASSTTIIGTYVDSIDPARSPYCNVQCRGYDSSTKSDSTSQDCVKTPCDVQPASTFYSGDYRLGILRLRVWG